MVKKLLLCVLLLTAMVSAAFGEADLWYDDYSFASLKDGKSDYSDARFGYMVFSVGDTGLTLTKENMSLTGSITFSGGSYSFWNGSEMQKVSGTPQTFRLAIPKWQAIGDEAQFYPFTDIGGELRLGLEAENGMNGVTLTWNFPDMPSLNGTYTVPNYLTTQEQMNKHVVYFEFIRSGENVTGINWRIVSASDTSTPVELDYPVNFIRIRIWNFDNERILNLKPDFYIEPGETPEGTLMFDEPIKESDIWRVYTKFYTYDEEVEKCYGWEYYTSTESSLYLFDRHASTAALVNGKSSYNNAKFSDVEFYVPNNGDFLCEAKHITDTGRITIPGGGYTIKDAYTEETLGTVAAGQDMTFRLKNDIEANIGNKYIEYSAANDSGRRIHFGGGAETALNGKTISWTFPAELSELNGSGTIPNYKSTAEQLISGVPYLEVVSEDGYITALKYKIVTHQDTSTAITPPYNTDFRLYVDWDNKEDVSFTFYESGRIRNTASGTWTLDTPQPLSTMYRVRARLYRYEDSTNNPAVYQWSFYPASADPTPTPTPDPTPSALTITTTTLPSGTTGTPYSTTLTANYSGVIWSLISGTLPSGLTLSSSGTISGTPTTSGSSSFTVRATSGSLSAEKSLSITVNPPKGSVGSSGGGCEAFAGLSGLFVLVALFRKPHHSA